jgi:hypothetical protein
MQIRMIMNKFQQPEGSLKLFFLFRVSVRKARRGLSVDPVYFFYSVDLSEAVDKCAQLLGIVDV